MNKEQVNEKIKEFCEKKNLKFRPWEIHPADVGINEPCPYPPGTQGYLSWKPAQELRKKLLKEIKNGK